MYLFPILQGLFRPLPGDDLKFSQRFVELLTSFAADGQPRINMGDKVPAFQWSPVNPANISHLNIGNQINYY